jgi:thioredoxin 1
MVRGFPKAEFLDSMGSPFLAAAPRQNPFLTQQGRTNMSEHIHHVTDDSFDPEVLQSATPVLVDYWAEWCGPCKMIAPILDEVAREYSGRLKVAKLNIDDNQATPPKYGIRGIPTLMIFKNGSVEATKVGALSKSQLTAFIDSHI